MAGIFFLPFETLGIPAALTHVPLYAGLGGLIYWALLREETVLRGAYAFTLGALFAMSDEIHQTFVPGRTFRLSDIDMDLLGVAIGIIVVFLFLQGKALLSSRHIQRWYSRGQ
jgi:VanZ family protein